MDYPEVKGELETLKKIHKGFSIMRLGDGEVGILCGKGYTREPKNRQFTIELNTALYYPDPKLLIGIPTMDPKGSRYWNWKRHIKRYSRLFPPGNTYYSAFISRPDCGNWMLTREYAQTIQKLWLGKSVTLIGSEPDKSKMRKAIELTQEVDFIECPFREAYSVIDELEKQARSKANEITILCHGASAACLAARLAPDMQAVDLGSVGGFLHKMLTDDNYEKELAEGLANSARV